MTPALTKEASLAGQTINITPDPSLFNDALRWAEVEGIEVYADAEGNLHANVSSVYQRAEAVDKLLGGIATAWVKAGMPRD